MKNSDPSSIIKAALEKVTALEVEIPRLKELSDRSSAALIALELSVDLADAKGLVEVTRLQTVNALVPRRISAREDDLLAARAGLLETCHSFVMENLGPRCRELLERIRAKVATELRPHFNELELPAAVEQSAIVQELQHIQMVGTIRQPSDNQTKTYALQLVQAWQDAATFEKSRLA